jgi:hypothetical protein
VIKIKHNGLQERKTKRCKVQRAPYWEKERGVGAKGSKRDIGATITKVLYVCVYIQLKMVAIADWIVRGIRNYICYCSRTTKNRKESRVLQWQINKKSNKKIGDDS